MDKKRTALTLTDEALQILGVYAGDVRQRQWGKFVSGLLVDYHNRQLEAVRLDHIAERLESLEATVAALVAREGVKHG